MKLTLKRILGISLSVLLISMGFALLLNNLSMDIISVILPVALSYFYISGKILIWSGTAIKENISYKVIFPIISLLLLILVFFYIFCATRTHYDIEIFVKPFWRKYWDVLFAVIFLLIALNIIWKIIKYYKNKKTGAASLAK